MSGRHRPEKSQQDHRPSSKSRGMAREIVCQHNSTSAFRQLLRLGLSLRCLSKCLLDLSVFERVQPLGTGDENLSELSRLLSDGLDIVVKLDRRFCMPHRRAPKYLPHPRLNCCEPGLNCIEIASPQVSIF
jgi:hypothetical protein